ncbi:MAG: hypothetical protein IPM15_04370 [Betaproteobacteria bacterium]|jgi:hypothetical protein|nr:hypothetical protein [Betaproteobacteria bacterium]MCC6248877.1 hypothetical protein [Rubrivivax sp.]MCL4697564.1 hypothetical protein [Burkholderiaceae bacterium]
MEVQLLRADGAPAADALVAVADAPVAMPDLGLVADAEGCVSIEVPVAGRYVLSVFSDGREQRLACDLAPGRGRRLLRLPG